METENADTPATSTSATTASLAAQSSANPAPSRAGTTAAKISPKEPTASPTQNKRLSPGVLFTLGTAAGGSVVGAAMLLLIGYDSKGPALITIALGTVAALAASAIRYLDATSAPHRTVAKGTIKSPAQDILAAFGSSIYSERTKPPKNSRPTSESRPRSAFSALFQSSRKRILGEIRSLSKRSNLNLAIGMSITAIALMSLGWMFVTSGASDASMLPWPSILVRFAFVAFVEIFAFFFLRLYRSGLTEIKYFQNELTNIEMKALAVEIALFTGDDKALEAVANSILLTERNPQLEAGHSTVELERSKLLNQDTTTVIEQMAALVSAIKKPIDKLAEPKSGRG